MKTNKPEVKETFFFIYDKNSGLRVTDIDIMLNLDTCNVIEKSKFCSYYKAQDYIKENGFKVYSSIANVTTINGKLHELIKDYTPEMENEIKEELPIVRFVCYADDKDDITDEQDFADIITGLCTTGYIFSDYKECLATLTEYEKIAKLEIYKTKPINVIKDYNPSPKVDVVFQCYYKNQYSEDNIEDRSIDFLTGLSPCHDGWYKSYNRALKHLTPIIECKPKAIAKITITHNANGSKLVVPQLDYSE